MLERRIDAGDVGEDVGEGEAKAGYQQRGEDAPVIMHLCRRGSRVAILALDRLTGDPAQQGNTTTGGLARQRSPCVSRGAFAP